MAKTSKKKKKPVSALQVIASKNIRFLRDEIMDVSQEAFADQIGCHRTYVGIIERAEQNMTLATLEAFAKGFNVHPSELLQKDMIKRFEKGAEK